MNQPNPLLYFFAGERSGDLHGSRLISALRQRLPAVSVQGVGGPLMHAEGLQGSLRMEDFEVMGFTDVLLSLPKLWSQFRCVRNTVLKSKPQGVVLIDYPGFNLRLAKALRQGGYQGKIVQYVSPSVWAHGKGRIQHMAETLDLLLAIFPFEPPYMKDSGLSVHYVGNPLQEYVHKHTYDNAWKAHLGMTRAHMLVGLFPGSRAGEIRRNLPALLLAAERLQADYPELAFAISCAHPETETLTRQLTSNSSLKQLFMVPREYTYELMRACRVAIAKSGTVTLELALHECPTVVVYRVSGLNRFIAQWILRLNLPHYCIVNILKGQMVFPELIARGFSPETIYAQAKSLFEESPARSQCIAGCREVKALLKGYDASEKAADKIAEVLKC